MTTPLWGGGISVNVSYSVPTTTTTDKWTTKTGMNTARNLLAGCGTTSAALLAGGYNGSGLNTVETYNGSSWSTGTGMINKRYGLIVIGTRSSAFAMGGYSADGTYVNSLELYNGSSWTTKTTGGFTRVYGAGCGTTSNALIFGGYGRTSEGEDNKLVDTTRKYNGSRWSNMGEMLTKMQLLAGCGNGTTALAIGGYRTLLSTGTYYKTTQYFNGSSWSTKTDMNTAKGSLAACGTSSAALAFGGNNDTTTYLKTTEYYNGSTWSTKSSMTTARYKLAGVGTSSDALSVGGYNGSYLATVEQYPTSTTTTTTKTETVSLQYTEEKISTVLNTNQFYSINNNLVVVSGSTTTPLDSYTYKSQINTTQVGTYISNKPITVT